MNDAGTRLPAAPMPAGASDLLAPVLAGSPGWPAAGGAPVERVVFLLETTSRLERRVLARWIADRRPPTVDPRDVDELAVPSPRRRGRRRRLVRRLEARLAQGDDPLLAPLRVAWLAPRRPDGTRAVTFRDALLFGDPREPGPLRQAFFVRQAPDRCRIVAGEPARLSQLRARWRRSSADEATAETTGLTDFVLRQAALALERAERRVRGSRYKVPRLVPEDILARPAFRGAACELARRLGRPPASILREAAADLREIAAAHRPTMIDLAAQLFRRWLRLSHSGVIRYDRAQLLEIAALAQRHPVVFLPTHKSNLDHPTLTLALYENGLPPNHTAGGINMNFFPLGPIVRRAGVFFIRRSFKDDEVYKLVLRAYLDYLVEKRFALEWYIEGGRARAGKLLPPRFGLLAYVVDAWRRGKSEDVHLVPVSIAYEQIGEIADYVAEQLGGAKRRESALWLWHTIRGARRSNADVHLRFGEPVSLRAELGDRGTQAATAAASGEDGAFPDERNLEVQKLAFEVCVRINRVTPITPTSLVAMAVLGVGDRALTVDEMGASLVNLLAYVRRKGLPTTEELELDSRAGLERVVGELLRNGVVQRYDGGAEPVFFVGPEQHLAAAFYRNTIAHYFVTSAIAELACLGAAAADVEDRARAVVDEALRVRDLLKFEFFFSDREAFRTELREELGFHAADRDERLASGTAADLEALLKSIRPFTSHRVLRPFLEAYRVVADALVRHDPEASFEEEPFLAHCLGLGHQYVLQRRIQRTESVSKPLFQTALKLARNRRLFDPAAGDLTAARRAFAAELDATVRAIDAIDALAAARRARILS